MRVLVGCEESQEICKAFRAHGHEAYSCDLKPCSGGHPEWHFIGNVLDAIRDPFYTYWHYPNAHVSITDGWDLFIVHPPCTDLAVSGARWFREKNQQPAISFFMEMANAPIPKICIENPVGIMSTIYRKPDQYIQPYQFGHDASKKTGLWLKGLQKLKIDPEQYVPPRIVGGKPRWDNQTDSGQNRLAPSPMRSCIRAKTYPGIAAAMAEQWG